MKSQGLPPGLRLLQEAPPAAEFIAMRAACGWGEISPELAELALARSTFAVTLWHGDQVAGFGRVLGDGLYAFLEDIIVAPAFQGQGLGQRVVEALIAQIERQVPKGAVIMLMAAHGKEGFYERLGFTRRPCDGLGSGMSRLIA